MTIRVGILGLCGIMTAFAAHAADVSPSARFLEIVDGDTAFLVDQPKNEAWWVVGECRRPIPMPKRSSKSSQDNQSLMSSEVWSETVQIGQRQVDLRQQFRFSFDAVVTVEVYNSLRGGWASVPVRERANCVSDAACRARWEVPEC